MRHMTEEQFVKLIKKSEAAAAANIKLYKFRLALFAAVGYAVIFLILTMLVLLVGGTVGIALLSSSLFLLLVKKKLIFIVIFAIWTFLKALWVKFEAPTGYRLERHQYPILFQEIDHLTKSLDALRIHQVILDNSLNAAVVQHPRFGMLGGQRNTLIIGLQLLLTMSPEEMRSVLAHEFGHLSGNHSRFAGWIYRVRITWSRLMDAFDASESFGARLMRRFFSWYAPTFSAYSFALARNNEYEADRMAADLTSPLVAAQALVNVHTQIPYLQKEYWQLYFRNADDMPSPSVPPFAGLADFLKTSPLDADKRQQLIQQCLQEETHYADTHPALKDRLQNLTAEPVLPNALQKNAAELWLGEYYGDVLSHFDNTWLQQNNVAWQERFNYAQKAKNILQQNEAVDPNTLNDDDLWQLAHATSEFKGDDAALPLYRLFQSRQPDSIGAAYSIGRILAAAQDEQALPHLRKALAHPNTIGDAAQWGRDLLLRLNKEQEAEQWWQEALQVNAQHQADMRERSSATIKDTYTAPRISAELSADLINKLAQQKNVGAVWLAQKVLSKAELPPVYIIAFKPKGFYLSYAKVQKNLAEALQVDMDLFIVCLKGDSRRLAKKVKALGLKIQ